jgi:hypothetical protein
MADESLERIKYPEASDGSRDMIGVNGWEIALLTRYIDTSAALHQRYEHDWGVAHGLCVSSNDERIVVSDGVFIDRSGMLGVLNKEKAKAKWISLSSLSPGKTYYITIRLSWLDESWNDGSKRALQTQVLALEAADVAAFDEQMDDTVVLAVVKLDSKSKIEALAPSLDGVPLARKLVGVPAGEIRLRRPEVSNDGKKISDSDVVTIRPTEHGMAIVGAARTFRLDVTQMGNSRLAGITFGETGITFDQDILTEKKIDGRDVSADGKNLDTHLANKQNPHGVTLQQLAPFMSRAGDTLTVAGAIAAAKVLPTELTATRGTFSESLTIAKKATAAELEITKSATFTWQNAMKVEKTKVGINSDGLTIKLDGKDKVDDKTEVVINSGGLTVMLRGTAIIKDKTVDRKSEVVINPSGLTIHQRDASAQVEGGGNVIWGNDSQLQPDQGGSIELGGNNTTAGTGTPYIDFHYGPLIDQEKKKLAQDYNARIINNVDGRLTIAGADKSFNLVVNGSLMFDGYLGTDGSQDEVRKKALKIVEAGPEGSLLLFFGGFKNDLCYAWRSKDKNNEGKYAKWGHCFEAD